MKTIEEIFDKKAKLIMNHDSFFLSLFIYFFYLHNLMKKMA